MKETKQKQNKKETIKKTNKQSIYSETNCAGTCCTGPIYCKSSSNPVYADVCCGSFE